MNIKKLQLLLSKPEGPKLDFKENIYLNTEGEKKELARDVCAIANSFGGRGYIIYGVEDKTKKVVGINKEDFNEEKIQQIISTRIDPPVSITAEVVNLHGKNIGIITIYNSNNRPHQLKENGTFYIRRGSTTDFMHKEEIAYMLQEYGLIHFEQTPVFNGQISDYDVNLIKKYFSLSGLNYTGDESQLLSSGFIYQDKETKKFYPTIGGILLFSSNPQIYLPHTTILIKNFIDSANVDITTCCGNIINCLEKASSTIFSLKKFENHDSVNFCLAKSIIERNYLKINKCIEVNVYKDKLEIIVPGLINKNNFKKVEFKNIWLYLKLLVLDENKKFLYPNVKKLKKVKVFEGPSQDITKIIIR
ncbi:helix-turn-helix domain-containing protein [Thermobrachium celere]|uniref:ATP-dependent DNA helicase n=1 Tax=Thermobrachium celere DSM 8682 TaxID=941824 RepID=R7RR95_9CLOT|nr:RNA-binding domain-containing protein [Thermobrachium celere]CDF58722.1 ATP-dependent DNA helicase [Thermobrachium celere DSM 8682]